MTSPTAHKWGFASRFRRNAFGWRSQPAVARIKEAVAEIKKTARKDPVLAADGAVLFLEKVSPALARVDSSSGAIGTAVNNAIDVLASIISSAPADDSTRDKWLDRLWQAVEEDDIPYIELLPENWGKLCATPERASRWADSFIERVKMIWRNTSSGHYVHFNGTIACLSVLIRAGRNEEVLALLELSPYKYWHYRKWGVRALSAIGRNAEAIRYAESNPGINDPLGAIAETCEEILLASGMSDEAYTRYAIAANRGTSHLSTFRAIAKKYPRKTSSEILSDLVESTPGEEGKWFASAKSAGLYDEAITLANKTPCDPRTLTRASKEAASEHPAFAVEAGMAALRWLCEGYGYEITAVDIWAAYRHTMEAAANAGSAQETRDRIRKLAQTSHVRFVAEALNRDLGVK
ncbi:MAG: hypothetical protein HY786_07955 [Deltaproteobacteria bacterium]|nr:hypothetical protein [Nitrospirota bacterium]MBI4746457.1 hypothetical protein [Deltaproteobacteria bacterium]